jgi:hypothetical protein
MPCVLLFVSVLPAAAADSSPSERGFDVLHYDAAIEPDIPAMSVAGRVSIRVRLPRPVERGQTRTIDIDYRGTPRFGPQFVPERSQVYTICRPFSQPGCT